MREADVARTNLEYLGYRVVIERQGNACVVLEASHESDVASNGDKIRHNGIQFVEGAGGTYDGWGAPVAQSE